MDIVRTRNGTLYESLRNVDQYGQLVELCDLAIRHAPACRENRNFLHGMIENRDGHFVLRQSPSFFKRLRAGFSTAK
jgi:hypothetical protein